jgi:hypothetical protein
MKATGALLVSTMLIAASEVARAGTICPASTSPNPFLHDPDPSGTGCNVVITINPDRSATVSVNDPNPYDGQDDALIGVVNNSDLPLPSIYLNGVGIFGFDGDGICTFTFLGNNYCGSAVTGYEGPTSSFSNINPTFSAGTVSFNPSLSGGGGVTYFSLEGLPSGNVGVSSPCAMTLTQPPLPSGTVGMLYSQQISVTGGVPPYSFQVSGLIAGGQLQLGPTGVISGTPTTPGTSSFTIIVTDAQGCKASQPYSITIVQGCITIAAPTLSGEPTVVAGQHYTLTWTDTLAGIPGVYEAQELDNSALFQDFSVNTTSIEFATLANQVGHTLTFQVRGQPTGCPAGPFSNPLTVTVTSASCQLTAVATATPSAICTGASTTLSGSDKGGAPVTCVWTPATGLANASACMTTASPTATTTYVLKITSATNPSCSSTSAPVTVTVGTAGSAPTIDAPETAYVGQAGLTASTGDPFHGYTWTISNGTITAGQGTSTITFTAGGPGALVLTVVDSTGGCASSSATKTIAVLGSFSVTLPVVAHVIGAGGVLFLTDVDIDNPNAFLVTATVTLDPTGGGAASHTTLAFSPFETKSIHDVVLTLFGLSNASGALRIETTAASGQVPPQLLATSRTYDQSADGSFGLSIPGDQNAVPQTTPAYVTGIELNPDFRTNLGGINVSSATETFVIVLRGPDGSLLGTSSPISLAPFGQFQAGLKDLFPGVFSAVPGSGGTEAVRSGAPTTGMSAEYQPTQGSTVPIGYGNLADNHSGDLTYFSSTQPTQAWYLPVLSLIRGKGNALFKSELNITNTSDSDTTVTVTFLQRDRDNRPQGVQATVPIHAHQTVPYSNALADLFNISDTPGTFGSVKVESSQNLAVSARIYTNSPLTAGTVGQQVDPIPSFYSISKVLGLEQDAKFRSNVGLLNPTQGTVSVKLTLFRSGSILGTATISVPPLGMTQQPLSGLFPTVAFPSDEKMSLKFESPELIGAYAVIADNVSQDLTTSLAMPLLAKSTSGSARSASKR